VFGEAEVLQVCEGDAGHQRVPVLPPRTGPRKVPEAEFLLELLERLLAPQAAGDPQVQPSSEGPVPDEADEGRRRLPLRGAPLDRPSAPAEDAAPNPGRFLACKFPA
jgi:hypothetical protein